MLRDQLVVGSYSFRLGELKPFRRRVINETEGKKQIKTKRRGAERVPSRVVLKVAGARAHTHTQGPTQQSRDCV